MKLSVQLDLITLRLKHSETLYNISIKITEINKQEILQALSTKMPFRPNVLSII